MKYIDIKSGDQFGDWTVIKRVANYKRERAYLCRCKCGKEKVVPSQKLRTKNECNMCRECWKKENYKHGDTIGNSKTPIYAAWDNMLRRCENTNHPQYRLYGGRGISVCKEWHNYEIFKEWCLENGWRKGLSLDRINNDGNYEPSNCRWTTQKVQVRNSRTAKVETIDGETKTRGEWLKAYNVSYPFVRDRIKKYGVSFAEAIKMPRLRARRKV